MGKGGRGKKRHGKFSPSSESSPGKSSSSKSSPGRSSSSESLSGKSSQGKLSPDKSPPGKSLSSGVKAEPQPGLLGRPLPVLLLLSLLGTLIYSNTFSSPFLFDDIKNLLANQKITEISSFLSLSGRRDVGFLSFALNYRFGGFDVFGYHLVNLLIHIANAFLVYTLVRLLFRTSGLLSQAPSGLLLQVPWAAALLFLVHPIQTQAVTYIIQRFTSLAALFYLLTLVAYLKWRTAPSEEKGRYLWYGLALLSCFLAMKTKENAFTLPLMILLLEGVFFEWAFLGPLVWRRWVSVFPFLLTLLIIPLSLPLSLGSPSLASFSQGDLVGVVDLVRETTEISRADYFFTQGRVLVTYIRLLFLPMDQNLDYAYPIYHSFTAPPVFLSFLFLSSLFALAVYLLLASRRGHHALRLPPAAARLAGFGILWFFLALAVESSLIPIRDVIFEHRLYLPSVGLFLAIAAAGAGGLAQRSPYAALLAATFSLVVVLLSVGTYQRNEVWKDGVGLWQDVVRKSPEKARARIFLAREYERVGRLQGALLEYQAALALEPRQAKAHNNLGNLYREMGRQEEALGAYLAALALDPELAMTRNNLGNLYRDLGRLEEALREYQAALATDPQMAAGHYNLANLYRGMGRLEEAVREYRAALDTDPQMAAGHYGLGNAYRELGREEEAMGAYQAALALDPALPEVHNNLAILYKGMGRLEEAIGEYQTALALDPGYVMARFNLGNAYLQGGRLREAIGAYQAAISLRPEDAAFHLNLGLAYQQAGELENARRAFEQALKLDPVYRPARLALESLG